MAVSGGAVSPENRSNEEIRANFAAAHEWVSDLCTGKRQWRMRVPVDAGDSDIVLSQAISDGETLLARIAAVEADRHMYAASLDSMTMRLVRLVEAAHLTPTSDDGEGMEGALKHFIAAALAASPTPTGPEG